MENGLLNKLQSLIKSDTSLLVEGNINKNIIAERARRYDVALLNTLQKDADLESHFFANTIGGKIFKRDVFLHFINNKEFLADSYTRYKTKIGLGSEQGSLLTEFGDVVLNWPYKDTVLEGGQSREESRRAEIFFNETLAPDQITRLLDKKVFTNWKRHTANGALQLDEIRSDDNLILRGNNLVVLHSLKERLSNKVDFIYIDPPYNTGNDGFNYNDKFNHATWLTFMKNRLEVAKDLLTPEGAICISVDDNEAPYLKVLLDQIFGRENFLATIAYERSAVSGVGQGGKFLVNTHESILCYARSEKNFSPNKLSDTQDFELKAMKRYNRILADQGKRQEVARFVAPSTGEDVIIYKHSDYKIETISLANFKKNQEQILEKYIDNFEKVHRVTSVQAENEFQNKILDYAKDGLYSADYLVSRGKKAGERTTAFYQDQQVFVWLHDTASVVEDQVVRTGKLSQFWTHESIPKADLANEGGVNLRRGKKPERLLKRLIEIFTRPGDLVLDYHLGSGTTAAVAHKLGRRYVGIEQLDYGLNDSIARLQHVIGGEQSGISKLSGWSGGGSFVSASIMNNSQDFRLRVEQAQGTDELMDLLTEATSSSFLSYRVNPKMLNRATFKSLSEAQQKELLIQLVDANTLYVNWDDINDTEFKVTPTDKQHNAQLYKGK